MLCAKFGWYWHSGLKCDKFTDRQTDEQTDDGRQAIIKAHLSFPLKWAKKDAKVCVVSQAPEFIVRNSEGACGHIECNLKKNFAPCHTLNVWCDTDPMFKGYRLVIGTVASSYEWKIRRQI